MESQPQNPEFRINPEKLDSCIGHQEQNIKTSTKHKPPQTGFLATGQADINKAFILLASLESKLAFLWR